MYLSPSKFEISLHFENFENPRIFFVKIRELFFFYDVHKENMLYFCRDSVKIQAFNIKQTKLSKNPSKNIMSRIITQGGCINKMNKMWSPSITHLSKSKFNIYEA